MGLAEKLYARAKEHERNIWRTNSYNQQAEDDRALLMAAHNQLIQLEYAIQQHAVFTPKGEVFVYV